MGREYPGCSFGSVDYEGILSRHLHVWGLGKRPQVEARRAGGCTWGLMGAGTGGGGGGVCTEVKNLRLTSTQASLQDSQRKGIGSRKKHDLERERE